MEIIIRNVNPPENSKVGKFKISALSSVLKLPEWIIRLVVKPGTVVEITINAPPIYQSTNYYQLE